MRPLYSLPPGYEKSDKAKLERYRERMQYTLEELEIEALSRNGVAMEKIRKVHDLQLKAPLIVYPPQRAKFDAEYDRAKFEKEAAIKEEQENKHKIDNIIYWLGVLDPLINGLGEMIEMSSE